ncbi:hypothetical protein BER93_06140 [Xanthomonas fragariae]|nr:hypothetical protein BER93_06140 [Xanthomonas fragariae]ENZ94646.1 hypothetical protein O1K_14475 [Xanthomonas fragariae LMG 25863]
MAISDERAQARPCTPLRGVNRCKKPESADAVLRQGASQRLPKLRLLAMIRVLATHAGIVAIVAE